MPARHDAEGPAERISRSRKYGTIHGWTIERVVQDCLFRYGPKGAERNARRVLHQVWGAFFGARPDFRGLAMQAGKDLHLGGSAESVLKPMLLLQSSTRERVSFMGGFFKDVLGAAGSPRVVVDHACGLNPLAAVMGMMPGVMSYVGHDIDLELISFLEAVSLAAGTGDRVRVSARDALEEDAEEADCVLMLKLLPCLDLQKKDGALEAMRLRRCKRLVVSFPVRSISGRKAGMGKFYEERFENLLRRACWAWVKFSYPSELVFVVNKDGG